jgi:hypothetical protein
MKNTVYRVVKSEVRKTMFMFPSLLIGVASCMIKKHLGFAALHEQLYVTV